MIPSRTLLASICFFACLAAYAAEELIEIVDYSDTISHGRLPVSLRATPRSKLDHSASVGSHLQTRISGAMTASQRTADPDERSIESGANDVNHSA